SKPACCEARLRRPSRTFHLGNTGSYTRPRARFPGTLPVWYRVSLASTQYPLRSTYHRAESRVWILPTPNPSHASISSSRLYFASRSDRVTDPILICPAPLATARSARKLSSVSPDRAETTAR